jgi:hypothetical protein
METRIPTVEEAPAEQRPALLPVEKLKVLCLEKFNEYKIQEFRLQGETESLRTFVDFCFLENGKYDTTRIVWITENAFVRLRKGLYSPFGCYRNRHFSLKLWATADGRFHDHKLYIHSSTTEEAIAALDLLAGLQDSYFKKMELEYNDGNYEELPICPLRGRHLEIYIRNANRENSFTYMVFTPDQCRTLASSGIRTSIGFACCIFKDEGIAFVEASAARANRESGPAKLSMNSLCFNERNLLLFIIQHILESLMLSGIRLLHEEGCRTLAAADLQNLELHCYCQLADRGAALVESVREGRGPIGLSIEHIFDSPERFLSFTHALRGNTYLERLDLSDVWFDDGSSQALTSALLENKELVHFGLRFCRLDDHFWSELMAAISTHPTLRTLKFRDIYNADGRSSSSSTKRERTQAVADMLLVNKHIDEIPFCGEVSFDRDDWNTLVAPRVECNLYRKLFVPIQKIQEPRTRAAIVAQALARVEKKPSLIWMILSQNHDVICNYLDAARTWDNDSESAVSRH